MSPSKVRNPRASRRSRGVSVRPVVFLLSVLLALTGLAGIQAPTAAAAGVMPAWQLPFENGQAWQAGAPHTAGGNNSGARGSADFGPIGSSNRRVVAVAAGTVYLVGCANGGSYLGVDHGNGWRSTYYHITNEQRGLVGRTITAGTYLGEAGQALPCGGGSTFNHVHLTILRDGSPAALDGMRFGNYTIHSTGSDYYGYWNHVNGQRAVTNNGLAACCLTSSTTAGPAITSSVVTWDAPTGWYAGQQITARFDLTNKTGSAIDAALIVLAMRDPQGGNRDVLCARDVRIEGRAGRHCSVTFTGSSAGKYSYWVDWMAPNGTWHGGEIKQSGTFDLGPQPPLQIQGGMTISAPAGSYVWSPINETFTVKNVSIAAVTIPVLFLAVRDPYTVNYDQACAINLRLAPGETKECRLSNGWGSTGKFVVWPTYELEPGRYYALAPQQTFTLAAAPGGMSVARSLDLSAPEGWHPSRPVAGTMVFANTTDQPLTAKHLVVAVRDPDGVGRDQVCANDITLAPRASKECSFTTTFDKAGTYRAYPSWANSSGVWHEYYGSQNFTLTVGVPTAPTTVTAVAGDAQATISWAAPASTGGSPITGYKVTASPGGKTVTVTDRAATITGLTNGTAYRFSVQATNVAGSSVASVLTAAVTPNPPAQAFADVPANHPFYKEISWLAAEGISTGTMIGGKKYYKPADPVNRDAMAAFMYRMAGSPPFTPPAKSPFKDVTPSTAFYKEITWLASTGITTGWDVSGGKEFRPLQPVNRDAMAAFMYRYAGSPAYTPPSTSPFKDMTPATLFYKEISWLASKGISTGWDVAGGKEYRPIQPVNRDAMAAFMYRLKNN